MEHKIDVLGCGVIYIDGERVLGGKPYGLFSTVNWSATDEDLKRIADRCLELVAGRKTEQTEREGEWMTYTEKELDQFLHGISLSLLSKKSAQHWRYDEETAKEIEWLEALERKVRADKADRKTEPTEREGE